MLLKFQKTRKTVLVSMWRESGLYPAMTEFQHLSMDGKEIQDTFVANRAEGSSAAVTHRALRNTQPFGATWHAYLLISLRSFNKQPSGSPLVIRFQSLTEMKG